MSIPFGPLLRSLHVHPFLELSLPQWPSPPPTQHLPAPATNIKQRLDGSTPPPLCPVGRRIRIARVTRRPQTATIAGSDQRGGGQVTKAMGWLPHVVRKQWLVFGCLFFVFFCTEVVMFCSFGRLEC